MPMHDWTRVDAGIFHAFHLHWIAELDKAFNRGILPTGYYSLAEQHAGSKIPDLLTLHVLPPSMPGTPFSPGGTAVLDAPPKVSHKQTIGPAARLRRRTLTIRHVSNHRLVAIVEIVSPANKDRPTNVDTFADKIVAALTHGVHALVLDLFPPGRHDPEGMTGAIWKLLEETDQPYAFPIEARYTLSSFVARSDTDIYSEYPSLGKALPDMPLFLDQDRYINAPLEATYQEAFRSLPGIYRDVLEKQD